MAYKSKLPTILQHSVLGPRAALDIAIPTGVDAGVVFRNTVLKNGMTMEEAISTVAIAVGGLNERLISRYGNFIAITQSDYAIQRNADGTRTMTPKGIEFKDADPRHALKIGHMLPIENYKDALAWSDEYLRDAPLFDLQFDVAELVDSFENRFDYMLFSRLLSDNENQIGTSGYDVGWAIGSGTNVNFIPPQYLGKTFSSTHTHYITADSGNGKTFADLIENMVKTLREHGLSGRLYAICSEDDLATIMALANFVKLNPQSVTLLAGSSDLRFTEGEFMGMPGELFGFYASTRGLVNLYFHPRVPQYYMWMTLPRGPNNVGNAVALKVRPDTPFGLQVKPQVSRDLHPVLSQINLISDFGIGVNDRLAACAGYLVAGGVWADATIT